MWLPRVAHLGDGAGLRAAPSVLWTQQNLCLYQEDGRALLNGIKHNPSPSFAGHLYSVTFA